MPLNPSQRIPLYSLWVYAALALAAAFFPAFTGRLPVPAGNAEMLLPDARTPPMADRNDELSDVPMQFLPWTKAVADSYRAGRLPLRLEANGCRVRTISPTSSSGSPTCRSR